LLFTLHLCSRPCKTPATRDLPPLSH
jgi:hypothetical protein